jgi:Galactose oxidase, central domain
MKKLIWVFIALSITSCEKEIDFDYPIIFTGKVTNITDTSASFSAKISNHKASDISESGIIWGVHSNDNNGIKIINTDLTKDIFTVQTNESLLPNKTYYVRAYVKTKDAITYGNEVSFESIKTTSSSGKWSKIYSETPGYSGNIRVYSSFTINDFTYFFMGVLYAYDHLKNEFTYLLSAGPIAHSRTSVVYNNQAYIFYDNAFYKFDPISLQFTKLSELSGNQILTTGFIIGDNIYMGCGTDGSGQHYSNNFWRYNITTNTWTQISSFSGELRKDAFSYSFRGKGYILKGYTYENYNYRYKDDIWTYDPEYDEWNLIGDIPEVTNEQAYGFSAVANNSEFGYYFYNSRLFEYNPIFNYWEQMTDFTQDIYYPYIFSFEENMYLLEVKENYHDDIRYFKMWLYEK